MNLYNKRVRPTKNEPQQGISYLERAREGVRERERGVGGQVSRQSYLRLGYVWFGRDRGERHKKEIEGRIRDKEIERLRNKETKRQS